VGVPSAAPYGFVELTPEREYLLVAEFLAGGKEILDAEVSRATIRDALSIIRSLWNAGIAHRDVKPSNLLARDGKVFLIDVAFCQVRPSPWRQVVDLANMMLVLALRTSPELVYQEALGLFSPGRSLKRSPPPAGSPCPPSCGPRSAKTAAIWSAPSGRWHRPGHRSAFSDGPCGASP
jgi:serine/threonine protein kinase